MKRILMTLLILAGFGLAGCEEEHEHHYGLREREHHEYREGRRFEEHHDGEYRFMNETMQNGEVSEVESAVQPQ